MSLLNLLVTVLNRGGAKEKEPWEKGNSWLINTGIKDIVFNVTQVQYRDSYTSENISAGITDISFVVTKV